MQQRTVNPASRLGLKIANEFRNDFRYALRMFRKNPGFTFGSIMILCLVIAANTVLFTFFSAYLLKPLPMKDPQRNVELWAKQPRELGTDMWSYAEFSQLRAQNQAFEEMYAYAPISLPLLEPLPRKVQAVLVSGNLLRLFNARMSLGRLFGPEEDKVPGRDPVLVLSHSAWRKLFHEDPQIVGKTLRIRQTVFTILGVVEPAFTGTDPLITPDFWAPMVMRDLLIPHGRRLADPENACFHVAGILKQGLSLTQAEGLMRATIQGLNAQRPSTEALRDLRLILKEKYLPLEKEVLAAVVFVFAAFSLVLLIACANLAGILLARGAARQREFAIRASLGASRGRLIRQLLTESILLCVGGAALSLILTEVSVHTLQQYFGSLLIQDGYSFLSVRPDWRVFLFAAALALGAGTLMGLVPALEATRIDLAGRMKIGAGPLASSRPRRIRELLLVGQVIASLVLLVMAGIFIRAAQRIGQIDPGIDVEHVIDVHADGTTSQLIARIKEDPRFETVSESFRTPLGAHGLLQLVAAVNGKALDRTVGYNFVDSQYFETLGIPILRGRNFTLPETRAQAMVATISEATARLLWPREDPIGKTLEVMDPSLVGLDRRAFRWGPGKYEVIGVVPDVVSGLFKGRRDRTAIYLPALPGDPRNGALLVRCRDTSAATLAALKKIGAEVGGLNSCAPISLRETVARLRFPFVTASSVSSGIGALALLMTCIGLYGVVAFAVVQRTREVGIRIALGATPLKVLRLIVAGSVLRVVLGIVLGIPLCILFSKIAASAFSVIETFDLLAYITVPLFLAAVALAAAYLPARRATRIDPIVALRQE